MIPVDPKEVRTQLPRGKYREFTGALPRRHPLHTRKIAIGGRSERRHNRFAQGDCTRLDSHRYSDNNLGA
jgi:hypothetical protein